MKESLKSLIDQADHLAKSSLTKQPAKKFKRQLLAFQKMPEEYLSDFSLRDEIMEILNTILACLQEGDVEIGKVLVDAMGLVVRDLLFSMFEKIVISAGTNCN